MADKLKGIQDLFSLLSRGAAKLNSLFSAIVFYFLLSRIIVATVALFLLMSLATNLTGQFQRLSEDFAIYVFVQQFFGHVILISVILTAADLPVKEVHKEVPNPWFQWCIISYSNIQAAGLRNEIMSLPAEMFQNDDDEIQVISTWYFKL